MHFLTFLALLSLIIMILVIIEVYIDNSYLIMIPVLFPLCIFFIWGRCTIDLDAADKKYADYKTKCENRVKADDEIRELEIKRLKLEIEQLEQNRQ